VDPPYGTGFVAVFRRQQSSVRAEIFGNFVLKSNVCLFLNKKCHLNCVSTLRIVNKIGQIISCNIRSDILIYNSLGVSESRPGCYDSHEVYDQTQQLSTDCVLRKVRDEAEETVAQRRTGQMAALRKVKTLRAHDRQCTYNVTLRCVSATIIAVENQ
jgi:hypothetical protein